MNDQNRDNADQGIDETIGTGGSGDTAGIDLDTGTQGSQGLGTLAGGPTAGGEGTAGGGLDAGALNAAAAQVTIGGATITQGTGDAAGAANTDAGSGPGARPESAAGEQETEGEASFFGVGPGLGIPGEDDTDEAGS